VLADDRSTAKSPAGDGPLIAATVVGVAAVVGLVASAATLVLGDFADTDRRWVAAGGVALGAVALLATWSLLRRLQRSAREQLALPLESRLFIAELDASEYAKPLPMGWKETAVRLYGRLVATGLYDDAAELSSATVRAQNRANAQRDER
jgi:hypothetical protein